MGNQVQAVANPKHLTLSVLWEPFAICKFGPGERIPAWALTQKFFSITKTAEELSLVCPQSGVPDGVRAHGGWRCFKVEDHLDFSQTGILASLANPLARAGVSIFATSTFDADYLMVPEKDFEKAVPILKEAGHRVRL